MTNYVFLIFFFISNLCLANMASPLQPGTYAMSAISSKDMDILNENIRITIDKHFKTAFYQVEYTIRNEQEGMQIPLLFHAKEYFGKFKVLLDGKVIELKEIPFELRDTSGKFDRFSSYFREQFDKTRKMIHVPFGKYSSSIFDLSDFIYFEVNLKKGIHRISVEYIGEVWVDQSDWLNEYSFRYSLAPAREWKSFQQLNVLIDGSAFSKTIHSNLGQPDSGSYKGVACWKFSKIPADYIEINFNPKPDSFSKFLIQIGPSWIALIFALLLFITHLFMIRYARKRLPGHLATLIVVTGSLVIPFFMLFGYCSYSFDLIDYTIGAHASHYHGGYRFFLLFLYVILMPLYWIGMYQISVIYKEFFADRTPKT